MKSLGRWSVAVIFVLAAVGTIATVSQFAEQDAIYVQGSIELKPELEERATGIRTLYMALFDADSPAPIPYGAIRYHLSEDAKGTFYTFVITEANLQKMPASAASNPRVLRVKARLDATGMAGPDKPGDLVGELPRVERGSRSVRLVIDRSI